MIPQLVTMRYRRPNGRWRRLWVPVVPVVLVLSPLLVLAVVGGLTVGRVYGISPTGALRGAGRILWALPGSRFEIEDGQTSLLVSVR
jgi:uncharacterized RDD family membrane protein YckC